MQALAEGVLQAHLAAAASRVPTVGEAVTAAARARTLRRHQAALGADEED
ncbi:hypothetical protein [Kitasatospora sp. NPDC001683]